MLGKRKRDTVVRVRPETGSCDHPREVAASSPAHELFRQFFESTFDPLPTNNSPAPNSSLDIERGTDDGGSSIVDSNLGDSEWPGLSDDEDNAKAQEVEVIDYTGHNRVSNNGEEVVDDSEQKIDKKSFMSSKPPRARPQRKDPKSGRSQEADETETLNSKHDLDLQRLLKESRLLQQSQSSSAPGMQRHKALDLRMQTLGSKRSVFTQDKMPLSHRRGIVAKETAHEATRRRQAQEAGIVLEKPTRKSNANRKRERGVDAPAVGMFRDGTLKLSRQDVANIQGPRAAPRKSKGRRR